jgi:hypothetical protein
VKSNLADSLSPHEHELLTSLGGRFSLKYLCNAFLPVDQTTTAHTWINSTQATGNPASAFIQLTYPNHQVGTYSEVQPRDSYDRGTRLVSSAADAITTSSSPLPAAPTAAFGGLSDGDLSTN